ncbi:MAG: hypothetical protein V9E88_08980 [Ferruginibacter sp.]
MILHVFGSHGFANFLLFMMILAVLNRYVFRGIIHVFQERVLPGLMNRYEKMLRWILAWQKAGMGIGIFIPAVPDFCDAVARKRKQSSILPEW